MLFRSIGASLVLASALFGVASPASAQFAKNEDAIKYRQSAFTLMSAHMGRLAAMVRGEQPFSAEQAQASARLVETFSHLPWEAFPAGSNAAPARVKGDLWKESAVFSKLQSDLKAETAKLAGAAGSLDGLKGQLGATSRACRNCHEQFRSM